MRLSWPMKIHIHGFVNFSWLMKTTGENNFMEIRNRCFHGHEKGFMGFSTHFHEFFMKKRFVVHGHPLVTVYVPFFTQIGQNLIGFFMWKIYAASGNMCFVETWILCHLILSCFSRTFALDLKNEIHLISRIFNLSFIAGVFSGFLVKKCAIWQKVVGNHPFQKYSSLLSSPSCTFKKVQKSY